MNCKKYLSKILEKTNSSVGVLLSNQLDNMDHTELKKWVIDSIIKADDFKTLKDYIDNGALDVPDDLYNVMEKALELKKPSLFDKILSEYENEIDISHRNNSLLKAAIFNLPEKIENITTNKNFKINKAEKIEIISLWQDSRTTNSKEIVSQLRKNIPDFFKNSSILIDVTGFYGQDKFNIGVDNQKLLLKEYIDTMNSDNPESFQDMNSDNYLLFGLFQASAIKDDFNELTIDYIERLANSNYPKQVVANSLGTFWIHQDHQHKLYEGQRQLCNSFLENNFFSSNLPRFTAILSMSSVSQEKKQEYLHEYFNQFPIKNIQELNYIVEYTKKQNFDLDNAISKTDLDFGAILSSTSFNQNYKVGTELDALKFIVRNGDKLKIRKPTQAKYKKLLDEQRNNH